MKKNYIHPFMEVAQVAGANSLLSLSYNIESGEPINYGDGD